VVSVFQTGLPQFEAAYGAVDVVFSSPQSYVSIDAAISRPPEGLGTPGNRPRLEVYDTNGTFLGSANWDFGQIPQPDVGAITAYQTLSYAASTPNSIGKVRFSSFPGNATGNWGLFDNLIFRSQCAHDQCAQGAALDESCDPCVQNVCQVDSYCCNVAWDDICVGEVQSVCGSQQCEAGALALDAFDSGHLVGTPTLPVAGGGYTLVGPIYASFDNRSSLSPAARQYLKFDLSGVTQSIASAELQLEYPKGAQDGFSANFSLQEVVSDPSSFGWDFATGAPKPYDGNVFVDLADGPSFGTRFYSSADEGKLTVVPLNAAGVAAINAALGGVLAIGGSNTGPGSGFSQLFENTGDYQFAGNDPQLGAPTVRRLVLIPSVCGNSTSEPGEECDDGNTAGGDGCGSTCLLEDDCQDGIDNDGDGTVDHPGDAGCTSAADLSENDPGLPCDDGADNDGDGLVDYVAAGGGDPGCQSPLYLIENPQCQDGLNNDNQPGIDFDGGASLDLDGDGFIDPQFNPTPTAVSSADPHCTTAWRNKERGSACGLGFELVAILPALFWLRRLSGWRRALAARRGRRRRSRARPAPRRCARRSRAPGAARRPARPRRRSGWRPYAPRGRGRRTRRAGCPRPRAADRR
jgi:cysteine-rich repeat protein